MNTGAGSQKHLFRGRSIAIYDVPRIVGRRLWRAFADAGFDVVFEGPLNRETARNDADIWVAKWTFLFKKDFLQEFHPARGIVTLSVGTEHIDTKTLSAIGLSVENCPSFSSNSVAEHGMALALRSVHGPSVLPSLGRGPVIFTKFSDEYAEHAVAHMLIRARQMDESIARAARYEYYRKDAPDYRHDEPWKNAELAGTEVGIIGDERDAYRLARILRYGFNCNLCAFDVSEDLDIFNPRYMLPPEMLSTCDYIFLCTDSLGLQRPSDQEGLESRIAAELRLDRIDTPAQLETPSLPLMGSHVAVLGTGNIGSIIARMAKLGFGCEVTAYDMHRKESLMDLGITYRADVGSAMEEADFIFIALPLNDGTHSLVGWNELNDLPYCLERVITNITRDQIIESDSLYCLLCDGGVTAYGTDVLPNDAALWRRAKNPDEEPDALTRKFVEHPRVIATPHEGDCSAPSLERMCQEALGKVIKILGDS
ncbi:MAG: NAD(P)-dependent oxidoreductase [Candidatus Micrarchaeota archaeon]